MNYSLLQQLVILLLIVVALNLYLTIRLIRIVRGTPEPQNLPLTLDTDTAAPSFTGTMLATGATFSMDTSAAVPTVIVFLSSGCSDCRERLPQLLRMLPAVQRAGIQLLVVGMERPDRIKGFLGSTPLAEHVLLLDRQTRQRLNPRGSSPFYLFIDHDGMIRATNFIGDGNWQTFVEQMREYEDKPASGAPHGD